MRAFIIARRPAWPDPIIACFLYSKGRDNTILLCSLMTAFFSSVHLRCVANADFFVVYLAAGGARALYYVPQIELFARVVVVY